MDEKTEALLAHFLHVLPYFNRLSTRDIGVSLTDTEKFLLYKPAEKFDMKVSAGDLIKPGSAVEQAIRETPRGQARRQSALWHALYCGVLPDYG